ncbi:MAG: DTW domain-containing protein [Polyangiaceae bacterium]|nr:DTW domain-containing protein [Polyangiaceae bacterium]
MRSSTSPDLAGRCPRCWIQRAWCLCDLIPEIQTAIEVVIVRHRIEFWRTSGTGRIAALALARCRIVQLEDDFDAVNAELDKLGGAWLLYPDGSTSSAASSRTGPSPSRLIVLDGSWRQARRMLKRLPALWLLPRLSLPDKPDPPLRLRTGRCSRERSTLESIADALLLFEGQGASQALCRVHELFVERSLRLRGRHGWSSERASRLPQALGAGAPKRDSGGP